MEAQERIGTEVGRKLLEYSGVGSSLGAVNFPQIQLPPLRSAVRFLHIHRNRLGVLARITAIFSQRRINIATQHLQTDSEIGYSVVDVDGVMDVDEILAALHAVPGTLRVRFLCGSAEAAISRPRMLANQALPWPLEHDPEKWVPAFGKDHASARS